MPDTVAYLVKGWPRLSEIFIASEIERLERLGTRVSLHVIKPADETLEHAVVRRIEAAPQYMPPTTSLSQTSLLKWLGGNLRPFLPALARVARRRPLGLTRAAAAALAQSVRARKGWRPRKIYAKEFLQAAVLTDRLLADGSVRRIHAHFAHGATTVAWLSHLMTGLPFSFTGHAKDIYSPELNPAGLLARKMRAATCVVTCTDANREHLEAICPDANVQVVYHGMNADFQRLVTGTPAPERNGAARVLAVGRLVPKKGFDTLIDAIGLLRDRGVDVDLRIAGESGAHEPLLRAQVRALSLDARVHFIGPKTQDELLDEYRSANVFCLPCRVMDDGDRDGIPNVLVEAMATGLPVVTSPISGIPELVRDGENGVFATPDDASALADGLQTVLADPKLGERLANEARRTVAERFDGDLLAQRMASLFEVAA
jgi:glycosyltransferase involved in cell wall biosynthesis